MLRRSELVGPQIQLGSNQSIHPSVNHSASLSFQGSNMSWFRSHKSGKGQASYEDDLICPISLALPIDPVTAEDGRVYDRDTIEAYFNEQGGSSVKSPWTGGMIGRHLLRAGQHRSIIERTIENRDISESLAKEWKDKMEEKGAKVKLLEKAGQGDLASIETVATITIGAEEVL